jgi:hypothetical protein
MDALSMELLQLALSAHATQGTANSRTSSSSGYINTNTSNSSNCGYTAVNNAGGSLPDSSLAGHNATTNLQPALPQPTMHPQAVQLLQDADSILAGLRGYSLAIPHAVPSRTMALAELPWRNGHFLHLLAAQRQQQQQQAAGEHRLLHGWQPSCPCT